MTTDNVREIPKQEKSSVTEMNIETDVTKSNDELTSSANGTKDLDKKDEMEENNTDLSEQNTTTIVNDKQINVIMKSDILASENVESKTQQNMETEIIKQCDSIVDNKTVIEPEKEKFSIIIKESKDSPTKKTTNCDNTLLTEEKSKTLVGETELMKPLSPNGTKEYKMKPPTPRRTGRKRKLSCLSPAYIELRRLIRYGELEPLKKYLDEQENSSILVNLKDVEGGTALSEIATKTAQFVDIAKLLVEHNVNVNDCDELGNTALHNSVMYYPATYSMVELLLNNGAEVGVKNISGLTPFDMSDDAGLKSMVKEKSGGDLTPVSMLADWLAVEATANTQVGKSPKTAKIYPALPESPGGILKRKKSRKIEQEKSASLIIEASKSINQTGSVNVEGGGGKKRRRSESDDDDLNESINNNDDGNARKSKRIRFNPLDSYGDSIDQPKFSEEDDSD